MDINSREGAITLYRKSQLSDVSFFIPGQNYDEGTAKTHYVIHIYIYSTIPNSQVLLLVPWLTKRTSVKEKVVLFFSSVF